MARIRESHLAGKKASRVVACAFVVAVCVGIEFGSWTYAIGVFALLLVWKAE